MSESPGDTSPVASPTSKVNGSIPRDDVEADVGMEAVADTGEGDDLFGAGDDDDDDEDEDAVVRPNRQRRKVDSASPSPSSPRRGTQTGGRASASATPRASPSASSLSAESYNALEHREISAEPPMGLRDADGAPTEIQEASFTLPSLPFRRGAPHYFARLPNLLQYRSEVFDEKEFDAVKEDDMLQSREGIRIDDEGLRSLLTTSNTIRWRWTDDVDADGVRVPESNARIIRWDDGSASLQLGSEFYDISQTTERVQGTAAPPSSSSSRVPLQPAQHLTHLFIKHDGQEQVNMYQSEAPIMGSFTFRPTSTTSESHQRLAKAVRKQKGTLVKETALREDPELEKERLEREEKKRGQKRMREMKKRMKGKEDDDDDAFWDAATRGARRAGARSMAGASGPGAGLTTNGLDDEVVEETIDDDGFVVDDENDDDDDGEDIQGGDVDVDDEPDEMELMEARMEKQEALRKAGKVGRADADEADGAARGDDAATTTRKRRVIDSDEE